MNRLSLTIEVIIPFRLREGGDPRRKANLDLVTAWWYAHGYEPRIVDDGLSGDAPFNRHRAYNRGVKKYPADVYVFAEADMLIHPEQIRLATAQAWRELGLVVPFTQYRYLSDTSTETLRDGYHDLSPEGIAEWWGQPVQSPTSIFAWEPESTMDDGRSIGAVNVVSRDTLEITGGFTEATQGNWYDDNITAEGFAFLTGTKTRHVAGPAVHLYHIPGHSVDGDSSHLTDADRHATGYNKRLLQAMRRDIRLQRIDNVRKLMGVRA